jgi:hypothetical protein
MSINREPFQRTDISTKPLGPTNYTGSNTARWKCKIVDRVQISNTEAVSFILSLKDKPELAGSKGEQEQ